MKVCIFIFIYMQSPNGTECSRCCIGNRFARDYMLMIVAYEYVCAPTKQSNRLPEVLRKRQSKQRLATFFCSCWCCWCWCVVFVVAVAAAAVAAAAVLAARFIPFHSCFISLL